MPGGNLKPGDSFSTGLGSSITAGWQKSDGSWTFDQNDPDFDNDPDAQRAKGQRGKGFGGKGSGER